MALPYPTKVVLPFDIATAQDMNERHANDVALAGGTGINDGAITASKLDWATLYLGSNSRTTNFTLSGSTNLTIGVPVTFTVPQGVTRIRAQLSARSASVTSGVAGHFIIYGIWSGSVSAGTLIGDTIAIGRYSPVSTYAEMSVTPGQSVTLNAGVRMSESAAAGELLASAQSPILLSVQAIG